MDRIPPFPLPATRRGLLAAVLAMLLLVASPLRAGWRRIRVPHDVAAPVPGYELPGVAKKDEGRRILVFLHDAAPGGSPFHGWFRHFRRSRWIVRSFALGEDRYMGSMERSLTRLHRFCSTLKLGDEDRWSLVAEGFSGLVARGWLADSRSKGKRPEHFVTLGSPHQGNDAPARGQVWGARRDALSGSFWLRSHREAPRGSRCLNLWFGRDETIDPSKRAVWPGVTNRELHPGAFKHVDFVRSSFSRHAVAAFLAGRSRSPIGPQQ